MEGVHDPADPRSARPHAVRTEVGASRQEGDHGLARRVYSAQQLMAQPLKRPSHSKPSRTSSRAVSVREITRLARQPRRLEKKRNIMTGIPCSGLRLGWDGAIDPGGSTPLGGGQRPGLW